MTEDHRQDLAYSRITIDRARELARIWGVLWGVILLIALLMFVLGDPPRIVTSMQSAAAITCFAKMTFWWGFIRGRKVYL